MAIIRRNSLLDGWHRGSRGGIPLWKQLREVTIWPRIKIITCWGFGVFPVRNIWPYTWSLFNYGWVICHSDSGSLRFLWVILISSIRHFFLFFWLFILTWNFMWISKSRSVINSWVFHLFIYRFRIPASVWLQLYLIITRCRNWVLNCAVVFRSHQRVSFVQVKKVSVRNSTQKRTHLPEIWCPGFLGPGNIEKTSVGQMVHRLTFRLHAFQGNNFSQLLGNLDFLNFVRNQSKAWWMKKIMRVNLCFSYDQNSSDE